MKFKHFFLHLLLTLNITTSNTNNFNIYIAQSIKSSELSLKPDNSKVPKISKIKNQKEKKYSISSIQKNTNKKVENYFKKTASKDCPEHCIKCLSDKKTCTKCESHYFVNSEKLCGECEQGCDYCNPIQNLKSQPEPTVCSQCSPSWYLPPRSSKCQKCLAYCKFCEIGSECEICEDCAYLKEGTCHRCTTSIPYCISCNSPDYCDTCEFKRYFQEQQKECLFCPRGCKSCIDSNKCLECESLYEKNARGTCSLTKLSKKLLLVILVLLILPFVLFCFCIGWNAYRMKKNNKNIEF